MLQYTYNGIDDFISTKSNAYHQLSKTTPIEDMPLSEAVRVLSQTPQLLRRPIIFDDHRLLSGFNQDEIRMFIPREQRVLKMQAMSELDCF
nr:ArsC/Spx/MgsR family protein [Pediococcus acidilactici]